MRLPKVTGRRFLLGTAAALVAASFLPPVQARAKALAVLAEALGIDIPRPLAADVSRRSTEVGGVTGDLYLPGGPAPAIVLVPGAAPDGPDDERVVRLATALARAERVVFVPEMVLARKEFVESDIEALVAATLALGDDNRTVGRPVFLGFSYGGSFALVAAADPRLDDELELVATFGAYYDLIGVAQAVTTGVSLIGSEAVGWDAHPRAEEVFNEVIVSLAPPEERADLEQVLLEGGDATDLSPTARRIHEFATHEDPTLTYKLADELPDDMKNLLARFSPATVAHRIGAPVIALHSTDDPVVPYGEVRRLAAGIEDARVVGVSLFRHVDVEGSWFRALPDLARSWRFTSWVLAAQE